MRRSIIRHRMAWSAKCNLFCLFTCLSYFSYAQPANDNCTTAEVISIANSGYGTGTFSSSNIDITSATVQVGELFANVISINGQNKKSIWFKFTVPTTRQIKVSLLQTGNVIPTGDVGFAVYKTNSCLPDTALFATKFTPIPLFGSSAHSCVDSGVYLVQVSSKANTAGLVSIQVESLFTGAIYDRPADAYAFGSLTVLTSHIDFSIACHSLDDAGEVCTALSNYQQYTKSTWHTFQTPAYFDYLSVLLSSPTGNFTGGEQVVGYKLYKGDARIDPVASLVPADGCDSLKTSGYYPDYKIYKCGELGANTTYTIQLFYKNDFTQNVRLAVGYGGIIPTKAPEPDLSSMAASNLLGVLASSPAGVTSTATDYLACNSRHAIHPCGDALPAAGLLYNSNRYNLSTFYTFTLSTASNISITAYSSTCGNPALLLRLYRQDVSTNCASLLNTNLSGSALTTLTKECLPAGTYTVQISGRDTIVPATSYNYGSLGSSSALCLLANLGQKVDLSIRVNEVRAINKFSMNAADEYDKVNPSGNTPVALQNGVAYPAIADTFGCSPTILPDTICAANFNRAMYRQFVVTDSGLVTLTNKTYPFLYKLYKGDANALAVQQNKFAFPDRITGLTPYSLCLDYYEYCQPDKVCVVPGAYTFTTFGGSNDVNIRDKPLFKLDLLSTTHHSPVTAQDMGSILDSSNTARTSDIDYFSCKDNAISINGYTPCTISGHATTKAIYRQFFLRAAAIVAIYNAGSCANTGSKTLFAGKATDGLAGLQPLGSPWNCFNNAQANPCNPLPAGWYTVVSYGSGPSYQNPLQDLNESSYSSSVGGSDQFTVTITPACEGPKYNRPYKAAIDTVTHQPFLIDWPPGRNTASPKYLYLERFNCTIDTPFNTHITPCSPSLNRVAYFVFRTTQASSIQISFPYVPNVVYSVYALDVRTDSALLQTAIPVLSCTNSNAGTQICNLPPGTYTLETFVGDNFNCSGLQPVISKPCNDPWYNRPYKAAVDSITHNPFVIDWGPRIGSTPSYPKTDTTYNLYTEYFDCRTDTPFSSHPVLACNSSVNRVAYYVFRVVRESYVQINTQGLWGSVYPLDVRTDSALLVTATPVQPCLQSSGYIQLCRLQPGTYTLVVFAGDANACSSVTPTIYIDQVGYSRFDHANKAYDFGIVPPDSAFHNGKTGDINPINAGRAPSSDIFYCTTGSRTSDPTESACYVEYNPLIYNTGINNYLFNPSSAISQARRNLWYSFVMDKPGDIIVKVINKTTGKLSQYPYAIYRSNVDPLLPFSTVISTGQVDSTIAQGLTFVKSNKYLDAYCYLLSEQVSFYRDPCTFTPARYYIVVDNNSANEPNSQVDVSIRLDSTKFIAPLFDHYSQAGNLGTIGAGTYTGPTDNFSCATRDAPDPVYATLASCTKNVWYKFTNTITGNIRFRMMAGATNGYTYDDVQLFRQLIPGDSTANGLQYQGNSTTIYNAGNYWAQTCISPGIYYLLLPGCNRVNEYVYPQIQLIEQTGDFCSAPVVTPLIGPGLATSSVMVNCHTIGTDYGEFNPTLTCPANATTSNYKTSWYRIDVTGADTLDVTVFISENTNAGSADIKYRMMTGSCGAMQEQSCVQDALTRNTYKCLAPGNSYYIQVFSPTTVFGAQVIGTIDLNISAVAHADSCQPANPCIGIANFTPKFDCTRDKAVLFTNFSTYGSSIAYQWDFGYNNQTSTAVSPSFFYPALTTAQTYTVKLVLTNTDCGKKDSAIQTITIPARPAVNLGRDTIICSSGATVLLDATSHPGSTYVWYNGSSQPTLTASGMVSPWAEVIYNGCKARDTINIWVNPIAKKPLQTTALCNVASTTLNGSRGFGEQYAWSTGATTSTITVAQAGFYWVDLYLNGCIIRDSFNVISSSLRPLGNDTTLCQLNMPFIANATVNGASSYKWQNNTTAATLSVTQPGVYWVDIGLNGCTFRDSILVAVDSFKTTAITQRICQGQTYFLPSGQMASVAGIYRDSLRNLRGCDSLITTLTLRVDTVRRVATAATICTGQSYMLPSGLVVNQNGSYTDTLRYNSGCDSLVTALTLMVNPGAALTRNPAICQGQSYMLPSGQIVVVSGTYIDTVRHSGVCDSIITTQLTVRNLVSRTASQTICAGETFTLPWGTTATSSGIYRDTIRYAAGCDSLVRSITLTVNTALSLNSAATICNGQSYILPWGATVTAAGIYADTIRYSNGCDSLINLFTLNTRTVTLQNSSPTICAAQSYTLPWGDTATVPGTYRDTLQYAAGCDSVIRAITLRVDAPLVQNSAATTCNGQSFTLPWGITVSTSGIYRDTLRYLSGCDSLVNTVAVSVQRATNSFSTPNICAGQTYMLPWGSAVTAAGIYRDTLHYASGCDSLIRQVSLSIKTVSAINFSATVCSGQAFVLPWGATANTTGIYSDTLRYTSGCDSLIRIVDLRVTAPAATTANPAICSNETFTLPWGLIVNRTGAYRDTIKSAGGCDSLVRIVNLTVKQQPVVQLSSTNNVDCMLSTTRLSASGGVSYLWTPSAALSNATVASPVASPTASTMYKVLVTAGNGCIKEDSLYVTVAIGDQTKGYLVPSAFTPNNDGINDCFGVQHWGDVQNLDFKIYNRWGHVVFYTTNKNVCWDGLVAGVIQKTNVFVYIITAKTICGPVFRKGTVLIVL